MGSIQTQIRDFITEGQVTKESDKYDYNEKKMNPKQTKQETAERNSENGFQP